MRMLYLYLGWGSGANQALLDAWRAGSPEVEITAHDLNEMLFVGLLAKLRGLPHALRRGGLAALIPGEGRFTDAVKRSIWYMKRISKAVERIQESQDFDLSLSLGTVIPNLRPKCPHFVYTDVPIRANAYYPEGNQMLNLWRECISYEEESLRKASMVFTMGSHAARSLVEQYGLAQEKVMCVNAGCNVPSPDRVDPHRFERQNVLFVGVDWQRKGGPQLIKAFTEARKRYPGATLTIVGCSPKISLPGVEVVGRVPQGDVPKYLSQASCFCMVSRREPFGIAYIEAMRAGLPVIASDLGAAPDFVIEGETGYRVDPDDTDALADRLGELLSNPKRCYSMGHRGRALVQSRYTWERTQRKMWAAICRTIKSR